MIRKATAVLMIVALLGLSAQPAYAARSLSKSFKVSVTLPASVHLPAQDFPSKTEEILADSLYEMAEITVIVRNKEKVLLRTIVTQ